MWNLIKEKLKLYIPEESFKEWVENTSQIEESDKEIIVSVQNEQMAEFIKEYYGEFIDEIRSALGITKEVKFVWGNGKSAEITQSGGNGKSASPFSAKADFVLNPDYTFETFVVGPSNELAHATCLAVAETPGVLYNPLYIYGDTGLGKTHLLHAVAHRFCELYPDKNILLVSAEKFFYDYIAAVRTNDFQAFRTKYRSVDVLLVDDIQFLAKKDGTREEFFNTFNDLFDRKKQIVISSDSLPKDIYKFQERLVSRFSWGIVADIQPPELETRVAILMKKAEQYKVDIEEEAIFFIARKVRKNVRELEGALKKLSLFSKIKKAPVSVKMAKEVLKDIIDDEDVITPKRIMDFVADYYSVPVLKLKEKNNSKNIVLPRQVAMYLCKQLTNLSYPEIGKEFGNKHHTTVMYACEKIEKKIASDPRFKRLIDSFIQSLR